MALSDTIGDFSTGQLAITRATGGAMVNGIWIPGTPITIMIDASVQPATGMARVVGGQDMESNDEGQSTVDVRQLYTTTQLFARSSVTQDPDLVNFEGSQWTVFRVEEWNLSGDVFFRVVFTKSTLGAS